MVILMIIINLSQVVPGESFPCNSEVGEANHINTFEQVFLLLLFLLLAIPEEKTMKTKNKMMIKWTHSQFFRDGPSVATTELCPIEKPLYQALAMQTRWWLWCRWSWLSIKMCHDMPPLSRSVENQMKEQCDKGQAWCWMNCLNGQTLSMSSFTRQDYYHFKYSSFPFIIIADISLNGHLYHPTSLWSFDFQFLKNPVPMQQSRAQIRCFLSLKISLFYNHWSLITWQILFLSFLLIIISPFLVLTLFFSTTSLAVRILWLRTAKTWTSPVPGSKRASKASWSSSALLSSLSSSSLLILATNLQLQRTISACQALGRTCTCRDSR